MRPPAPFRRAALLARWAVSGRGLAALGLAALATGFGANPGRADPANPYPRMAPLEQYLMPQGEEIALARSAAPDSISRDAEVMVLGPKGYVTVVPGTNGFVCLVERAWSSPRNDPGFWNPKSRSPLCFNAAGARYCVPLLNLRTVLALAGLSKDEIAAKMQATREAHGFPALESGAMCYMLSRQGRLNDTAGHWHPHVMFFLPLAEASTWGANLDGSPVVGVTDDIDDVAVFMVPVKRWSDGSEESKNEICSPTAGAAATADSR